LTAERSYKKLFLEKSVYFGIDGNGIPQKIMYVKDSNILWATAQVVPLPRW
jgi:hypothetical protein